MGQHHVRIINRIKRTSVAFVADINRDRVESVANKYKERGIVIDGDASSLPDVDIAVISVPLGARDPYIRDFGSRVRAIFCEKPFARDMETHARFTSASNIVGANYMRLWWRPTRDLKQIVESDMFGSIKRISVSQGTAGGKIGPLWADDPALTDGGILTIKGSHSLSQLVFLLQGYNFEVIDSTINRENGVDIDISTSITAINGSHKVDIDFDLSIVRTLANELRLEFDDSSVVVDHPDPSATIRVCPSSDHLQRHSFDISNDATAEFATDYTESWVMRWMEFLNTIEETPSCKTDHSMTEPTVSQLISNIYATG
jgi:predicted dehydrogenase